MKDSLRGPLERIVGPRAEAETCLRQRHGLAPLLAKAQEVSANATPLKESTKLTAGNTGRLSCEAQGGAKRARSENGGSGAKPRGVLANETRPIAEASTMA